MADIQLLGIHEYVSVSISHVDLIYGIVSVVYTHLTQPVIYPVSTVRAVSSVFQRHSSICPFADSFEPDAVS